MKRSGARAGAGGVSAARWAEQAQAIRAIATNNNRIGATTDTCKLAQTPVSVIFLSLGHYYRRLAGQPI